MKTPTLTEMGINNPGEITRYTMSQLNAYTDELTIYYKRQKGSLLPVRRAYEFGRAMRSALADSGTGRIASVGDVSPRLLEAVAELDRLLAQKGTQGDRKAAVLEKLSRTAPGTRRAGQGCRHRQADCRNRIGYAKPVMRCQRREARTLANASYRIRWIMELDDAAALGQMAPDQATTAVSNTSPSYPGSTFSGVIACTVS